MEKVRGGLNAPQEKQDDEDDDDQSGTATEVMIPGTEAIATAAEE